MLNLVLLKLFAVLIVVDKYHLAESASQNQKYFKQVRSHGKCNITQLVTISIGLLQVSAKNTFELLKLKWIRYIEAYN